MHRPRGQAHPDGGPFWHRNARWVALSVLALRPMLAQAPLPYVESAEPTEIALGTSVTIKGGNLEQLAGKTLVPYLNGYPMRGSRLDWNDGKTQIRFTLMRDDSVESRYAWSQV